ncbi:DUF6049 family protein [Pseudactinotalea sp. Z1739]|uniref:DUF6049 family protein n=1 Tax=Pseudactinotalea sp. Z1739 TaxID=3413028 RepID=UPI003C7CECEB
MNIPSRARSTAGCVLVLVLWLGLALTAPPAAANPQEGTEPLRVELTSMSPAVLRPEGELTVRATVHNDSSETVTDPSVRLIMQRHVLTTRAAVDAWQDGTTSALIATATPFTAELEEDLEPHSTTAFTITMPSSPTFAETSAWGPRGIEVDVTGILEAAPTTGSARSLLLWFPSESPLRSPAELSVLTPLTPTGAEWHQAASEGRPVGDVAATRLLPVLRATSGAEMSWALDPALLESAPPVPATPLELGAEEAGVPDPDQATPADGSDTDPGSGDNAPPSNPTDQDAPEAPEGTDDDNPGGGGTDGEGQDDAANGDQNDDGAAAGEDTTDVTPGAGAGGPGADPNELATHLIEHTARRDVVGLDYADTDLPALAHAGDLTLWRLGQQRGAALLNQARIAPLTDVHWPGGRIDGTTLAALAGEDAQVVVTPEYTLAPDGPAGLPGSPTQVSTTAGEVRAVVPDERISALLTGHDASGAELDSLTARQLLLADTAAAMRESGEDGPGFLATLPRDVSEADLDGHLRELADAPWMDLANLRELLGRTPGSGSEPRTAATATLADPHRLAPEEVLDLEQMHDDMANLAATLPDRQGLLDQVQPGLLTSLSASWANEAGARDELLERVADLGAELTGAVRVEPGSSVLLINHSGELPVAVANDLPVPAQVTVALQPQDPRLRASEPISAVLDPETITTVRVPIQAVANGNVELDVQLLTEPEGEVVGQGASFVVRVRADWEDIGTAVVAVLLAVAFLIGLVRTIRSGKRRFDPAAASGTSPAGPAASVPRKMDSGAQNLGAHGVSGAGSTSSSVPGGASSEEKWR